MITVRSLNVGGVKTLQDARGVHYQSAVRRTPCTTPQFLNIGGFAGDASFEPVHHTPSMDVHVFSIERYAHYERLAQRRFPIPAFGENLTIGGAVESDVCIGDVFAVGDATVQLTQPTERCGTPGRSLGVPRLLKWIDACLFTGWYMRVLRPGWVSPGDTLRLIERPLPRWSVERINDVVFRRYDDAALYKEVLSLPLLSAEWKARMYVLRERFTAR
jgi:MOSC domain-containing protein YiiM